MNIYNGMPATALRGARWCTSTAGHAGDAHVELAKLGNGEFAVRNSGHPDGPALVYTRAEIAALVEGAKAGEFDDLLR